MAADGKIEFEISADGKKAIASVEQVTRALQQEGQKWKNVGNDSASSIENAFNNMAKKITGAFTAQKIGQALLNFGKEAISAASDLAEVQNVVDVTFGDAGSAKIESWAKNASKQFGLTETQAKRFSSTLGAMMKSAGMSGDEVAEMSMELSGLAADMASFYNLDFDTAFQKIRSGISGETEPLKQLGINMGTANLQAYALEQGITKAFDKMSQSEQTVLRYQYLMQATADAQGDFSRTSEGYANAGRRVESALESIKTSCGNFLMQVVEPVTGGLADFLETLTQSKPRTVLDDFAAINLKTAEKITEIELTAAKADALAGVLSEMEGTAAEIGPKLEEDLKKIDIPEKQTENVKNMLTELDNVKTLDLGPAADEINKVNRDINGTIRKSQLAKSTLENIGNAKLDGNGNGEGGVGPALIEIGVQADGISEKAGGAADALGEIATAGSSLQANLEPLADATDVTTAKSAEWLEVCGRLVQTIPGLSSIINTETGEIEGGSEAVKEYIKNWEELQKYNVLMDAHEQKQSALDSKFAELPGLEIDKSVAEYRVKKAGEQLDGYIKKYGLDNYGVDLDNLLDRGMITYDVATAWGLTDDQLKTLNNELEYYQNLQGEVDSTTKAYNEQKEAYEEAKTALEVEGEALKEQETEEMRAARAAEEHAAAVAAAQTAYDEAAAAMKEYRDKAVESTLKSVEKLIGGFEKIESPAEKTTEKIKKLYASLSGEKDKTKQASITEQIKELEAELPTAENMIAGLNSQLNYMQQYQADLKKAQGMGISAELLATLSDGSAESADYLAALRELDALDPEEKAAKVKELNDAFASVQEEKQKFAEALTDGQLAVDESYKELTAAAEEAEKKLEEVKTSSAQTAADTVSGIANEINNTIPYVQAAVNRLNAVLAQIGNGYGGFIPASTIGSIAGSLGGLINGSYATGLDYVPFNGFLAELHEGESVLTAEEARVWRQFRDGGAASANNIDYDALGGLMRDNVKGGGNVYLDGQTVGRVISQMQGNSYRSLQRSGWQG